MNKKYQRKINKNTIEHQYFLIKLYDIAMDITTYI